MQSWRILRFADHIRILAKDVNVEKGSLSAIAWCWVGLAVQSSFNAVSVRQQQRLTVQSRILAFLTFRWHRIFHFRIAHHWTPPHCERSFMPSASTAVGDQDQTDTCSAAGWQRQRTVQLCGIVLWIFDAMGSRSYIPAWRGRRPTRRIRYHQYSHKKTQKMSVLEISFFSTSKMGRQVRLSQLSRSNIFSYVRETFEWKMLNVKLQR